MFRVPSWLITPGNPFPIFATALLVVVLTMGVDILIDYLTAAMKPERQRPIKKSWEVVSS